MVIAVGTCAHPLKAEAEALADFLDGQDDPCSDTCECCKSAAMLRRLAGREPSVKAGDTVIFPWTAGREVQIDDTGDRYLIMREADLLAVLEDV